MRDLSLHLMDILQNSISAKASKITVSVYADQDEDMLVLTVSDNGVGMDEELLAQVTDPFVTTRTTRRVGLGISLLKFSAESAGGKLTVDSQKNAGTVLIASFKIGHIDRLPLGDVAETMASLIMAEPEIEFELQLLTGKGSFMFNSFEIKGQLGEVPINQIEVIAWIREYIDEGVKITFGGVLDEVVS